MEDIRGQIYFAPQHAEMCVRERMCACAFVLMSLSDEVYVRAMDQDLTSKYLKFGLVTPLRQNGNFASSTRGLTVRLQQGGGHEGMTLLCSPLVLMSY